MIRKETLRAAAVCLCFYVMGMITIGAMYGTPIPGVLLAVILTLYFVSLIGSFFVD